MLKLNAIDLFCGVGGLTYGIGAAGIHVVAGYDIDAKSKFPYEANNQADFILKDVQEIQDGELASLYPADMAHHHTIHFRTANNAATHLGRNLGSYARMWGYTPECVRFWAAYPLWLRLE